MPRRRNRQLCECGCGQMTETGRFLRGHATRVRWALIKAAESTNGITHDTLGTISPDAAREELGRRKWVMPESRRTFGIEFELTSPVSSRHIEEAMRAAGLDVYDAMGYTRRQTPNSWTIKTDGSIIVRRPGWFRYEITSPVLRGKKGEQEIRKALGVLNELGCDVNKSCGTHVHVGASDLSVEGVKNVVLGYDAAHDGIDNLMPGSRRNGRNSYCLRYSDWEKVLIINATTVSALPQAKYRTVNMATYPRLGTLEFRQHQGTLNADKILTWLAFVRKLVQTSGKIAIARNVLTDTPYAAIESACVLVKLPVATTRTLLSRYRAA